MKRSVVVLAALLALALWQGAGVAQSLSGGLRGDIVPLEKLGPDSDRMALEPEIISIPEQLDMVGGAHGDAPVMVEQ